MKEVPHLSTIMNCNRCNVEMNPGKAFKPTPVAGIPDFIGDTDLRGRTISMTGPGELVDVLKCPQCGHSVETREPTDTERLEKLDKWMQSNGWDAERGLPGNRVRFIDEHFTMHLREWIDQLPKLEP